MDRRRGIIIAGAVAVLVARYLSGRLHRFEISEPSMRPALEPGDYIVTRRSDRPLCRGEIVVFEHPARPSFFLVKRVVGLPGERVELDFGTILIDGSPRAGLGKVDGMAARWQLGPREAFVLGDDRRASADDSRRMGPLPVEALRLRVVFRYWPFHSIGTVR